MRPIGYLGTERVQLLLAQNSEHLGQLCQMKGIDYIVFILAS